jgi:anti-sigma B factor antagonist
MQTNVHTIPLVGLLDGVKAKELRQTIQAAIEAKSTCVLVDLTQVQFIDSSGLGALVLAFKSIEAMGGRLFFCGANEQAKMLFELTGVDQVFKVYPSQQAFANAIAAQPAMLA